MATRYAVNVTATEVVDGRHETTCRCSCGWSLTTAAASAAMASQVAARAEANHLADAHPRQGREARTPVPVAPVVRGGVSGHTPFIGMAFKDGILWTRSLTCSCGWDALVSERTPFQADKALRSQHRAHVNEETDRAPVRDYVVLLGLIVVVLTLCLLLASAVVDVSAP